MEEDSQNQGEPLFLAPAPPPGLNPGGFGPFGSPKDGRGKCRVWNGRASGLECENREHSLATLTVFTLAII